MVSMTLRASLAASPSERSSGPETMSDATPCTAAHSDRAARTGSPAWNRPVWMALYVGAAPASKAWVASALRPSRSSLVSSGRYMNMVLNRAGLSRAYST
jgi:hypothetical protein